MNILNLEHISKIYGDKVIFDDISCGIHQGDKIGIIGINGTGKTTTSEGYLQGWKKPDEGQVIIQNGTSYHLSSAASDSSRKHATVLSYVADGTDGTELGNPET